jgi:hypothetical protein
LPKKGLKRENTRKSIGRGEEGFIQRKRYTPIEDGSLQLLNKSNNYAGVCLVLLVGVKLLALSTLKSNRVRRSLLQP